jgi:hypothetical protein
MITALTILGIYFGGMICFALWDAHIGFGVEFDGGAWPPAGLAYIFWPVTLFCAVVAAFSSSLDSVKEKRIKKAEQQKRIRVAAEKEQEALLEQIEREMLEEESSGHVKAKGAHRR